MKKINVLVATVIVALGVSATSCDSKRSASLKTGADSASYAIGIANGSMFKQNLEGMPGGPVNIDDLLAGFRSSFEERHYCAKMTMEQAQAY